MTGAPYRRPDMWQLRADKALKQWAGTLEQGSASVYPAEWWVPQASSIGAQNAQQQANPTSDAAHNAADAVTAGEARRPQQAFPLPDHGEAVRLAGTGRPHPRRPAAYRTYPSLPSPPAPAPVIRSHRRGRVTAVIVAIVVALGLGVINSVLSEPEGTSFGSTRASGSLGSGGGSSSTAGGSSSVGTLGTGLSPYGLPTDVVDLGVQPADQVFTFAANSDLWDSGVDGWRLPSNMVRVYLDPELTVPAPDADIRHSYDEDDLLIVSPSGDTVMGAAAGIASGTAGADIAIGERWGAASDYYLTVLCDLQTGEPLDRLEVQHFTVDDDRPRPQVSTSIDAKGVLSLTWENIDGAVRYDVLNTEYGFTSLGTAAAGTWSSDIKDSGVDYRQNEALAYLGPGASEDSLSGQSASSRYRQVSGVTASALLADGRITLAPIDSAVLAQVPLRQATNAWWDEDLNAEFNPGDLPGALPYEMADGSTALLPVTYDPNGVAARNSIGFDVPFQVHGARGSDGTLRISAASQDEAVQSVTNRVSELDAQRDPNGAPQPYVY